MKIFRKLFFLMLFGLSLSVFAQTESVQNGEQATVYTQDKPVILVSPDKSVFTIKLKSNPTTGYSWYLRSYDNNLILPVSHHFQRATSQLVGAPGFELWNFKVKPEGFAVPQVTYIRFVYTRPFEPATQGNTEVEFKVTTVPTSTQTTPITKPVF